MELSRGIEVPPIAKHEFAIFTSSLTKSFGTLAAVVNLDLEISPGEIFGLLGPNGAGKTTTMRILSCLIRPTSGRAFINGSDVLDLTGVGEIRREIGLLTENPNIYERLTPRQNLLFFARAYGLAQSKAEERVERVLRDFDLVSRAGERSGGLSKGMKQKLAIARALIHEPSILLLDEPTSSLDAESARTIRELILETAKEDHTILLSTHNLDDASRLCDRIGVLDHGRLLAVGTEVEIHERIRAQLLRRGLALDPCSVRVEVLNAGRISLDSLRHALPEVTSVAFLVDNDECDRRGPPLHSGSRMMANDTLYGRGKIEFVLESGIQGKDQDMVTARIISALVHLGGEIIHVERPEPTLEEAYLNIMRLSR